VFEAANDANIDYSGNTLSSDGRTPASGYSHVTGCTFKGNGRSWKWPNADRVQAMLRERAMQAVVAPGDHAHQKPTEIHAEVTATEAIGSVTLRLPEEFQRVLVVSYRPSQTWIEPRKESTAIRF
jgi:hypothetical protein